MKKVEIMMTFSNKHRILIIQMFSKSIVISGERISITVADKHLYGYTVETYCTLLFPI